MSAQPFSASYAQAREKFLEAVNAAGLQPKSHIHPLKGRDGETLARDLAWVGDPQADRLQGRPDASADQARQVRDWGADGAIVGSALVNVMAQAHAAGQPVAAAAGGCCVFLLRKINHYALGG